jgi:hypothetical protein
MLRQISTLVPEELGKPLLAALILLMPGSFLVLPVLALFRLCASHGCNGATQALRDYFVRVRSEVAGLFNHTLTQEKTSL